MGRNPYIMTLIPILPAVLFVVIFVILIWTRTRKGRRDKRVFAPARRRKMNLLLLPVWVVVTTVFGLDWLHHREKSPWPLLPFGLLVLMSGYEAFFRRSKPGEDLQNWACDTAHCGHCGYDLTGNVSGICPECGTPIPPSPDDIQKPWWGAWWMQWQIDHLDNWRKTLTEVVALAAMFAGLAVWLAFGKTTSMVFALVPILICASLVINCVRILQYRRRIGDS